MVTSVVDQNASSVPSVTFFFALATERPRAGSSHGQGGREHRAE
jgi:hypothetical protein